jgi:hypothetical protein
MELVARNARLFAGAVHPQGRHQAVLLLRSQLMISVLTAFGRTIGVGP